MTESTRPTVGDSDARAARADATKELRPSTASAAASVNLGPRRTAVAASLSPHDVHTASSHQSFADLKASRQEQVEAERADDVEAEVGPVPVAELSDAEKYAEEQSYARSDEFAQKIKDQEITDRDALVASRKVPAHLPRGPRTSRTAVGDVVQVDDKGSAVVTAVPAHRLVANQGTQENHGQALHYDEAHDDDPHLEASQVDTGEVLKIQRVDGTEGDEHFALR